MIKAQYDAIVQHAEETGLRLRFHLVDGKWFQGKSELLGSKVVVLTTDNKQLVYIDLESVIYVTTG